MKKVIIAAFSAIVLGGAATSTIASVHAVYQDQNTDNRVVIKLEELPDAVKNALSGDQYKDFTAQSAAVIKSDDKVIYVVSGTQNGQPTTLHFAEDGSVIAK